MLTELNTPARRVVLVDTPTYHPDAIRIERLWRALRRAVTHTHQRRTLDPLLVDADQWATALPPDQVLRQIGSPFARTRWTPGRPLQPSVVLYEFIGSI